MLSINDGQLGQIFFESNIYEFEYDKYLKILDAALADFELSASDVLGVSQTMDLVAVLSTGVVRADQRGVFNKRVEVGKLVSYASVGNLIREQRQPHGRESWLKLMGPDSQKLAEIGWYAGGNVEIADAARERDRIYEIILKAAQAPQATSASGATASGAPSISGFSSKKDFLVAWSESLVGASGVAVTPALVDEHARMAAGAIGHLVFLRLGAPQGITDLRQFFPDGHVPDGHLLDSFDEFYAAAVGRLGGPGVVDPQVDEVLGRAWNDWTSGIREHYG
ncbi:MAG: hypothetical protein JSS68_14750 [Actinobacteria bacterium]|nr:hypothetical protein [Actinomycetota bacterium]